MNEILKVKNISKTLDTDLFSNLTFSFKEGTINAILMPGNSGKTTLIKTLTGIIYSDEGSIIIDSTEVRKDNLSEFIVKISTILDDISNQFICNKVIEELKFPLENLGYKDKKIDDLVEEIADLVDIKLILGKDNSRLTYIEKVKVLIGASIIHNPKILFIDDIFKLLNQKEKVEVRKIINKINKKFNTTIVLTSSDLEDVIDLKNIIVIKDKKIFLEGSFDKIVEKDNELVKMGISIPLMVDLSMKLKFYNLVDKIYYDPDKVVDTLWN